MTIEACNRWMRTSPNKRAAGGPLSLGSTAYMPFRRREASIGKPQVAAGDPTGLSRLRGRPDIPAKSRVDATNPWSPASGELAEIVAHVF